MKKFSIILSLFLVNFSYSQYNPSAFGDLYLGSTQYNGILNLYFSTQINDKLLFNRKNDDNTYDLLVTEGNSSDVTIIKTTDRAMNMFVFNGKAYFGIMDASNGAELWSTDGTLNGTIKEATIGGNLFVPINFVESGTKMYFSCGNINSGNTRQLYVLSTGSSIPILLGQGLYDINSISSWENGVIFGAATSTINSWELRELYKSDGTEVGTSLIKDINNGNAGSNPDNFFIFNNKFYFTADDGVFGREIWSSDGTNNGTILLKDINTGSNFSTYSFSPGILDDKFYFSADNGINGAEIWVSDGTTNGTNLFLDMNLNGDSNPSGFVPMNNKILFLADNGINGKELWTSDGSLNNTEMLLDINPGNQTSSYALFQRNKLCDNQLFFDAGVGTDIEPWVTDGTVLGTYQIGNLNLNGSSLDYETYYVDFKDKIYFGIYEENGRELYVMEENCDLTILDDKKLIDINVYPNPFDGKLTINAENETKISIFTLEGKEVLTTDFSNEIQINTENLKHGSYIVRIQNANKVFSKLIVKE